MIIFKLLIVVATSHAAATGRKRAADLPSCNNRPDGWYELRPCGNSFLSCQGDKAEIASCPYNEGFSSFSGMCVESCTLEDTSQPDSSLQPPPPFEGQFRVVGGDVSWNEYPGYVELVKSARKNGGDLQHMCSGIAVSENAVITAGHCVSHGTNNLFVLSSVKYSLRGQQHTIQAAMTNPHFLSKENKNCKSCDDVAVLHVSPKLPRKSITKLRVLATEGTSCIFLGLDSQPSHIPSFGYPSKVLIELQGQDWCAKHIDAFKGDNQVCGLAEGTKASTQVGDSGGPLLCLDNGGLSLMGVLSMGYDVDPPSDYRPKIGYPMIFTKISSYTVWLQNTINKYRDMNIDDDGPESEETKKKESEEDDGKDELRF